MKFKFSFVYITSVLFLLFTAETEAYTYDRHVFGSLSSKWMKAHGVRHKDWGDLQKYQVRYAIKWWGKNCKQILKDTRGKNDPHYFPKCPTFKYQTKAPKRMKETLYTIYLAWLGSKVLDESKSKWDKWLGERGKRSMPRPRGLRYPDHHLRRPEDPHDPSRSCRVPEGVSF